MLVCVENTEQNTLDKYLQVQYLSTNMILGLLDVLGCAGDRTTCLSTRTTGRCDVNLFPSQNVRPRILNFVVADLHELWMTVQAIRSTDLREQLRARQFSKCAFARSR